MVRPTAPPHSRRLRLRAKRSANASILVSQEPIKTDTTPTTLGGVPLVTRGDEAPAAERRDVPEGLPCPAPPRANVSRPEGAADGPGTRPPGGRRARRESRRKISGFTASLLVHAAVLVVLSLIGLGAPFHAAPVDVIIGFLSPDVNELELDPRHVETDRALGQAHELAPRAMLLAVEIEVPDVPSPLDRPGTGTYRENRAISLDPFYPTPWLTPTRAPTGGGLGGRSDKARGQLVGGRGGTPGSEKAAAGGLAWLAAHQRRDGSWRFNHHDGPCQGLCRNPGTEATTTGATALALLPFLGANHTHVKGTYRDTVDKGLYYLRARGLSMAHGIDLQEGTMYAQGLAAIALCEAYAMTEDRALRPVAQGAVDFICHAQHPKGGWRYVPGQPGDTTVFGWQLMALKSAQMAGLEVPSTVIHGAKEYLDGVQTEGGAYYGYLAPGQEPSPTAIGLLARMYLGCSQDDQRLALGTAYLSELGPSETDVYFNYYATQVLHHYEGPQWDPWNERLREYLLGTQAASGHESGSWYFPDKHAVKGGRLYTTAMCVMILEVYYRYMPLYAREPVESGF